MTSKPPSVTDERTLQEHNANRVSIEKRDSTSSEKPEEPENLASQGVVSEKALEAAPPKFDESKILEGRKLFLAFAAMLLSVLLIALG